MGIDKDEVMQVIYDAGREFPDIWNKINDYKSINLSNGQKIDFATKVIEYNWGKKSVITPEALIIPKRNEDQGDDLFTTYSIIQESLQKGGVIYNNPRTGRVRRTRAITNGTRDFQLNTVLWSMMESFREEKVFKIA